MKNSLAILAFITIASGLFAQTKLNISELEFLDKTSWSGSLMYVNYGDGKEVTLKSTMQIKVKGDKLIMYTQFIDEPDANSKSSIRLKRGGTYFGQEKIIESSTLDDGTLKIITQFKGKDNNKPATLFKTYLLAEQEFSVTKKVKYEGLGEELIRNRYNYSKILTP